MYAFYRDGAHWMSCGCMGIYNFFDDPSKFKAHKDNGHMVVEIGKGTAVKGGIGYTLAAFNGTALCKKAYDIIKENHKIVFESPVKPNPNSGCPAFFFIIFTKKD